MSDSEVKTRTSKTGAERVAVRDRTDEAARITLSEERRRRDAKTERLRAARLQAEEQSDNSSAR